MSTEHFYSHQLFTLHLVVMRDGDSKLAEVFLRGLINVLYVTFQGSWTVTAAQPYGDFPSHHNPMAVLQGVPILRSFTYLFFFFVLFFLTDDKTSAQSFFSSALLTLIFFPLSRLLLTPKTALSLLAVRSISTSLTIQVNFKWQC